MDGDVMPFCKLDYLFNLSEPEMGTPLFKENVLLAYTSEPAHGGFFMLAPKAGHYQQLQSIIEKQEKRAIDRLLVFMDDYLNGRQRQAIAKLENVSHWKENYAIKKLKRFLAGNLSSVARRGHTLGQQEINAIYETNVMWDKKVGWGHVSTVHSKPQSCTTLN